MRISAALLAVLAGVLTGPAPAFGAAHCSGLMEVARSCPQARSVSTDGGEGESVEESVDHSVDERDEPTSGFDAGNGGATLSRTQQSRLERRRADKRPAAPGPSRAGGTAATAGTGAGTWAPIVVVRDGFTSHCKPGPPCDPTLVVRTSDLVDFSATVPDPGVDPPAIESGLLLGFPAEVRFTPVGDAAAPDGALGATYSAEYRFFAPDWLPVQGTVTVPGAPLDAAGTD